MKISKMQVELRIVKLIFLGVIFTSFSNLCYKNITSANAEDNSFLNLDNLENVNNIDESDHIDCIEKPAGVVKCTNGNVANINEILSQFKGEIKLTLNNCKFPNAIIPEKWITLKNIEISVLNIQYCNISEIQNNAFNSETFKNTSTIILNPVNLFKIGSLTFAGLDNLKILKISNYQSDFKSEQPLNLLKTLEIFHYIGSVDNYVEPINIFNLLSTNYKNIITEIKLSGIIIADQFLMEYSPFVNYDSLQSLTLSNCKISNVSQTTFFPVLNTLNFLDLSRNEMINYPVGTFTKFLQKDEFKINLTQNQWICDCNIMHFIKEVIKFEKFEKYKGTILCSTPSDMKNKKFVDVKLNCSDTLKISCSKTDYINNISMSNQHDVLEVKNSNINFRIQNVNNSDSKVNVTVFETELFPDPNIGILVHNYNNDLKKLEYKCFIGKTKKSFIIDNMSPGVSYTICTILVNESETVSPFNCKSFMNFRQNETISENKEDHQQLTIEIYIIFISATVCSFLIGLTGMYFILRRNPLMIRKSSKVLNVNSERKSIMVSGSGYKKKKLHETETIKWDSSFQRPLKRSFSDSISTIETKTESSYITPNDLYETIDYAKRDSILY